MLFENQGSFELLFIKRATNLNDRWSGQIAFPGGKREDHDATLLDTCLREVREEVGIELSVADLVGSLGDIQARKHGQLLPFFIEPFVFVLEKQMALMAAVSEVEQTFWISIDYLLNEKNQTVYVFDRDGIKVSLPGILFPSGDILWGLTYMMLSDFLEKWRKL